MKTVALLFAILSLAFQARAVQPEPVLLISYGGQQTAAWYAEQARLWEKAVDAEPRDAGSWRNYYLATAYSYLVTGADEPDKQAVLDRIFASMEQAVSGSYEFSFIRQYRTSFADLARKTASIQAALERCPDCAELYPVLAAAHELAGEQMRAVSMWNRLYQSQYLAPGLLEYGYNMLMSVEDDAILFTNGDNDTFPAWMLQRVRGIRADVLLLNLHLVRECRAYLERRLSERGIDLSLEALPGDNSIDFISALVAALDRAAPDVPVYFALTVSDKFKGDLHENLYIVGLASRYSTRGIDNLGRLQYNLENRFRLDSLNYDWYSEDHPSTRPVVTWLNANYAYPFFLLSDHYRVSGDTDRAVRWRERALEVARSNPFLFSQLQNRITGEP